MNFNFGCRGQLELHAVANRVAGMCFVQTFPEQNNSNRHFAMSWNLLLLAIFNLPAQVCSALRGKRKAAKAGLLDDSGRRGGSIRHVYRVTCVAAGTYLRRTCSR